MRLIILLALSLLAQPAAAVLRIVTTTETLAGLVREIGGDRVDVVAMTRGTQDPHRLEARPDLLVQLARADALVLVGLELEVGWLPRLIDGANNPKVRSGSRGHIDTSAFVTIKEKPTGAVDRSQGDVHPLGNPHYWLEPINGAKMAKGIAARLAELDPEGKPAYDAAFRGFMTRLKAKVASWEALMKPHRGKSVVTYHRSWTYLLEWLGLTAVAFVEPKPGVAPSPSHLAAVAAVIREQSVKVVLSETYFGGASAKEVASLGGATLVVLPQSVGGVPAATGYLELMDLIVGSLAAAL